MIYCFSDAVIPPVSVTWKAVPIYQHGPGIFLIYQPEHINHTSISTALRARAAVGHVVHLADLKQSVSSDSARWQGVTCSVQQVFSGLIRGQFT